jgi:TIR domain-containing protein
MPVKIFFCYAHEDESLLKKLKVHLMPLQRQGLIAPWYDRDISAGTEWEQEIKEQLNSAQIILLLVSPDFIASDYVNNVELKRAIERHNSGEACVIPVILYHIHWQGEPLGKLQALPTDANPVTSASWHSLNEALFDVAEGVRKIIEELGAAPSIDPDLSRVPDFSDPLTQNTKEYQWTEVRNLDGSCVFRLNGYHITTLDQFYRFYKGISEVLVLSNFVLQVDMKVMVGEEGGVLFRWNNGRGKPDTFYYFYIWTDGTFGLEKGEETSMPVQHRVLAGEPNNKHVNKGLGQQNKLMVRAVDHVIELSVNEQFLYRIDDNANPHLRGHIGFASGPKPSEVIFSNVKVWKIN